MERRRREEERGSEEAISMFDCDPDHRDCHAGLRPSRSGNRFNIAAVPAVSGRIHMTPAAQRWKA
ncbi:MAG TPA: hypothetical protein VKA53_10925 [Thermoanaerobaculia bacterium]|nr:hypothetical protein [Thermoanaerobaculia bacterium]